ANTHHLHEQGSRGSDVANSGQARTTPKEGYVGQAAIPPRATAPLQSKPNWPILFARQIVMEQVVPETARRLGVSPMTPRASASKGILGKFDETPRPLPGDIFDIRTDRTNMSSPPLLDSGV